MPLQPLTPALTAPITDRASGEAFIDELARTRLLWHFDDCAVDCLAETNRRVSPADARTLNDQRDALYDLEWGEHECPIGYALTVLED